MKQKVSKICILLFSVMFWGCTHFLTTPQAPSTSGGNGQVNTSQNTPKTELPSQERNISIYDGDKIKIQPITAASYPLNDHFIAFNTGFMFTAPLEKEPAVKTISQAIQPSVLRFPGGTVANYYHPDGLGYGIKEEETKGLLSDITKAMPLFDKNAIYHFADLCKMSNSKVVFVSNLLTGTVEETLWCLDYFQKQNIPVIGVELGNEFYFRQYRDVYSTVDVYIQQAKEYAEAIRKKYPTIKIGVVASGPTPAVIKNSFDKFLLDWDSALGKETFYDFYIPHLYSKVQSCEQRGGNDLNSIFNCADVTLAPEFYNYFQIISDYFKKLYGSKKMWITEWNIDAGDITSNTIRHAEFVGEFLIGMIDFTATHPEIEYAFFHNYGSGGYAAPIFTYSNKNNVQYLRKEGNIAYNSTCFPFLYLRELINQNATFIQEKIEYPKGLSNQQVVFKTFLSRDKKRLFLYFVNKTSQTVKFEVEGANGIQKITGIYGDYPWSVAGWNGIYKNIPQKVDMIQYIPPQKDSQDYSVPKNSVGYIEIGLK